MGHALGLDGLMGLYPPDSLVGRPILELGARVWHADRYGAFLTCYGAMRTMDDLVDLARTRAEPLPAMEKRRISSTLRQSVPGAPGSDQALARIQERYGLPRWTWDRWTEAMVSDLDRTGFGTFRHYLRYAEGAAVAPGSIFMHLCAVRWEAGRIVDPRFDVRAAARPLAIFCYLVHILRDFREDQLQGLQYFADDLLRRCGIRREELASIAAGAEPGPGFHRLITTYARIADHYLGKARRELAGIRPLLEPRYFLSLDIVLSLYLAMHEAVRLDVRPIARGDLRLDATEALRRIEAAMARSRDPAGYDPDARVAVPAGVGATGVHEIVGPWVREVNP
jgi:phytoene/squalene synthetase